MEGVDTKDLLKSAALVAAGAALAYLFPKALNCFTSPLSEAKFEKPYEISAATYSYLLQNGLREPEAMQELRQATAKHPRARMMAAPEESCFFTMLMKLIGAQKVIEVGVFTGYTTLALALGLPENGKVVGLDITDEFPSIGKPYWKKAGVDQKIDLKIGPGIESLDKLIETEKGTFDFAFVDADKTNYANYFEKLLPLMKKGGLIAFDNVLWHGKVSDEKVSDPETESIRKLNLLLKNDKRIEMTMLPLADGVTFVRVL